MPTIVVADEGKPLLLDAMVRRTTAPANWRLHLYRNVYTPDAGSTVADFQEATFSSYAPVDMPRSGWTAPALVAGLAVSFWGEGLTMWFAPTGSQRVWGAYVTDSADAVLLWAWRFDVSVLVGGSVPAAVRPWMRLRSIF